MGVVSVGADDEGAGGGKQRRRRSTSRGKVKVMSALLMQFRAKMFPKLPATTRGICFARRAVAATRRRRLLVVIFYIIIFWRIV